jgi:hypothetical protein
LSFLDHADQMPGFRLWGPPSCSIFILIWWTELSPRLKEQRRLLSLFVIIFDINRLFDFFWFLWFKIWGCHANIIVSSCLGWLTSAPSSCRCCWIWCVRLRASYLFEDLQSLRCGTFIRCHMLLLMCRLRHLVICHLSVHLSIVLAHFLLFDRSLKHIAILRCFYFYNSSVFDFFTDTFYL